jgi:condensin-2 complex subunit D3
MSSRVRAYAFICLGESLLTVLYPSSIFLPLFIGKLCLQNEDLAKSLIAALARELDISDDLAVRNNIIIIMGDLCVRLVLQDWHHRLYYIRFCFSYTNMVDRYVANMTLCLRDRSPLIRKQALTVLTRLLQEDYFKWRGPLFFNYAIVLVDNDKEISDFCQSCL